MQAPLYKKYPVEQVEQTVKGLVAEQTAQLFIQAVHEGGVVVVYATVVDGQEE